MSKVFADNILTIIVRLRRRREMGEPLTGLEQAHLRKAMAYSRHLEEEARLHGVEPDHSITAAEVWDEAREFK